MGGHGQGNFPFVLLQYASGSLQLKICCSVSIYVKFGHKVFSKLNFSKTEIFPIYTT